MVISVAYETAVMKIIVPALEVFTIWACELVGG